MFRKETSETYKEIQKLFSDVHYLNNLKFKSKAHVLDYIETHYPHLATGYKRGDKQCTTVVGAVVAAVSVAVVGVVTMVAAVSVAVAVTVVVTDGG